MSPPSAGSVRSSSEADREAFDVYQLRRNDYSLTEEQDAVQQSFREFFAGNCPSSVVRDAEPGGFDPTLWKAVAELGAVSMGVPEDAGGDGAELLDLCLVTEEVGRALAPVPLIDQVVTLRALATAGAAEVLADGLGGGRIMSSVLEPCDERPRYLVSSGVEASDVLMLRGDELVLVPRGDSVEPVHNQGSAPLAWWDAPAAGGVVVADGTAAHEIHQRIRREWKILTAAALAGMSEAALWLGVEFVKTRETMGVVIGTLQGISFPLADVFVNVAGARNLARRAAWLTEHDVPGRWDHLAGAAHAYASSTATHAATVSAHVQGGLGFTIEADVSLYFLRAKAWTLLGGDPADDELAVGRALVEAVVS